MSSSGPLWCQEKLPSYGALQLGVGLVLRARLAWLDVMEMQTKFVHRVHETEGEKGERPQRGQITHLDRVGNQPIFL